MLVSSRHKKPIFKTRVVKKISEILEDDWKKVYPDVPENYGFFKNLDEADLSQFDMHYIIIYDKKIPVAATPFFLLDYSLDMSISGPIRRLTNSVKKHLPNVFSIKAVVCGFPMGEGHIGIIGEKGAILNTIVRKLEQVARKNKAAVIAFKDFDHIYSNLLDPLKKTGFAKFDSLPTTRLNVRFNNFEEYIKTLSSVNRYDLRRKFKKIDGRVKIKMEIVDTLDEMTLKDIYKLYLGMVETHDMKFELLPIAFFKNISKNIPGNAKYFLWKVDGKLVAFLLCLVSKDILIDYYTGLDYSIAHKYHLYFLNFRDVLNWCIENNIKIYEMGTTGYEPKRRLGFEVVPLFLYVKLRNRTFRPFFNLICHFLKFEHFDPSLKKAKKRQVEKRRYVSCNANHNIYQK